MGKKHGKRNRLSKTFQKSNKTLLMNQQEESIPKLNELRQDSHKNMNLLNEHTEGYDILQIKNRELLAKCEKKQRQYLIEAKARAQFQEAMTIILEITQKCKSSKLKKEIKTIANEVDEQGMEIYKPVQQKYGKIVEAS